MSDNRLLVVDAFRRAFSLATELGVNVKVVPPTVPLPKYPYVVRMEIMSFEDVGSYLNQVDEKGARIMLRSSSIWMTDSTDDVDFDVDEDDFDDSDDSDLEDEDDEEDGDPE